MSTKETPRSCAPGPLCCLRDAAPRLAHARDAHGHAQAGVRTPSHQHFTQPGSLREPSIGSARERSRSIIGASCPPASSSCPASLPWRGALGEHAHHSHLLAHRPTHRRDRAGRGSPCGMGRGGSERLALDLTRQYGRGFSERIPSKCVVFPLLANSPDSVWEIGRDASPEFPAAVVALRASGWRGRAVGAGIL